MTSRSGGLGRWEVEAMVRRFSVFGLSLVLVFASLFLAGEAPAAGERRVTRIVINKQEHTLELKAGEDTLASYKVALGPGGPGPKLREGDKVTPVGRYHVMMHQPSQYRVFLRLDYPNADDVRRFAALKASGDLPKSAKIGSDIGIHGPPVAMPDADKPGLKAYDWTWGCIALDDAEILEVARRVKDGTPVDIED
jgi:murein L,D-transpeptidase YafK